MRRALRVRAASVAPESLRHSRRDPAVRNHRSARSRLRPSPLRVSGRGLWRWMPSVTLCFNPIAEAARLCKRVISAAPRGAAARSRSTGRDHSTPLAAQSLWRPSATPQRRGASRRRASRRLSWRSASASASSRLQPGREDACFRREPPAVYRRCWLLLRSPRGPGAHDRCSAGSSRLVCRTRAIGSPRPHLSRRGRRTAASARQCTSRAARGRRHPPRYCFPTRRPTPRARIDRRARPSA